MGVVTLLCALWVLHLHVAPAHGVGLCTPERAQAIRDSMGPSISEATKCPEPTWKHAFFHDLQNATRPAVVYDIGCNKGFDALATLKSLTHNPRVSLVRWKQKTGFDCGVCGQCQEGARGAERPLARERLQLFCVEPMPGTFGVLLNAASHFKYNRMGLIVQYGAFTSRADAEKRNWFVKFPTGPSKVGRESVGLHNAHSERLHGGYHWQEVPLYVLDEHVQQYLLPRIDVLSIDTEGNDPLVLEGGVQTLSTMVRYVEFEYHNIGAWLSVELKDVLEQLEKMGFVCYWLGKAKLWRITGCWHQDYAVRQWSNIGCVHVTNTEWYATMEDIFKATVPQ